MTTYRIWLDDGDEHDPDERTAASPQDAAMDQAQHDHDGPRCGYEWSWPVTYLVEDVSTGQRWRIAIDREVVPHFRAGRAVEVA